jgi:predicted permease
MPISGLLSGTKEVLIEGQTPLPDGRGIPIDHHEVTPRYFKTLGMTLVQGRDFSQQDQQRSPGVVIINEAMRDRFWPGEDPLGKQLRLVQFMAPPGPYLQVIGVVKNTRYHHLEAKAQPHIYLPLAQDFELDTVLFVRSAGDPKSLMARVRQEIKELDQELPVSDFRTLADWMTELNSEQRMTATLIGSFGLLALLLAAVGLYGVMSYTVAQRTQEIGIRLALGAQARDLLYLVVGRGMFLTVGGVAIGLAVAFVLTQIIASRLYGVSTTDPVCFIGAAAVLVAVAFTASYIPARRATKVDPMVVLHHE